MGVRIRIRVRIRVLGFGRLDMLILGNIRNCTSVCISSYSYACLHDVYHHTKGETNLGPVYMRPGRSQSGTISFRS